MESGGGAGNGSSNIATVNAEPVPQQPLVEAEKKPTAASKKRKETEPRSKAWEHFEKIKDETGTVAQAKCLYCSKIFNCHSKKYGTSSIRNHILSCLKNPHPKEKRQTLLTLQPSVNVSESDLHDSVGVIGTWKFDQDKIRHALTQMIVLDELPFKFVEAQGFKKFISVACPRFKIPSRRTFTRDCFTHYLEERSKLKTFFKEHCQRVSLTTDSWTSIQRINYMCITAHFIDDEWQLHKKIISFVPVTSHKGEYIAKALETCLLEWGLKNVFTVTLDNAASNDTAISFFKKKLLSWGTTAVRCKYVHMRCIAHILNLIVNEGLKESSMSVKRVREAVRYIRISPSRLTKFKEFSDLLGIEYKSALSLDVPTRWNSTYLMLQTACLYEKVFEKYDECEPAFRSDLGDDIPDYLDWISIQQLVDFLKFFYKMTLRISGSLYVTANTFFSEISDLFCVLNDWMNSDDSGKRAMGFSMKSKLNKYWGDPEKMNMLIFFANILDPRDKLEFMEFSLTQIYGESVGGSLFSHVRNALFELFHDYVALYSPPAASSESASESVTSAGISASFNVQSGAKLSLLKAKFKKQKMEVGLGGSKQSELDIYLSESILEDEGTFDVIRWWKLNSERFPILSRLARDVLAIPISTVASESTFSTVSIDVP